MRVVRAPNLEIAQGHVLEHVGARGQVSRRERSRSRGTEEILKHSEREHVHREETDFKRLARRNKMFGLWAAEQLGFHGDAAEAYAREVIYSDLEEPGEDDMFRKVTADLERHGKTVTREQLAAKLGACLNEAQEQIR